MFGLIGHLTNLEHAQSAAKCLGVEELADKGLEVWCSAPPFIVETIKVTSITGQKIEGKYVESCFLPEMLTPKRINSAKRKIQNAMAHAQKHGIDITALGGFSSIVFENFNLEKLKQIRNVTLEFKRFTTGNTHTAYIICRQLEQGAQKLGIDLSKATVAVCGATGDIGSGVCRWLNTKTDYSRIIIDSS